MSSIRLHPKHGLNPTISKCIICGKDKNKIVLLGAAYKEEAPMHMVTSIIPCDTCKKQYLTKGVMLVESDSEGKVLDQPQISIIKTSAFKRIFNGKAQIPASRIIRLESAAFTKLGLKP